MESLTQRGTTDAPRVYIADVAQAVGGSATLNGWVVHHRASGKIQFFVLRDGTGTIQCVIPRDKVTQVVWDAAAGLTQESSLTVSGVVREDPRSPGGYELGVTDIVVHQLTQAYPITPKEHGTQFLMDHRHLWLRSARQHAVLRVRSELVMAARLFFYERGFTLADAPIFTPSACEGTTTLFETDYFGEKVYLTQSGQLYNEATAMAFGKTVCFGPTFRAEKSKTRRHLIEFWMIEPEVAFAELDDVMHLAEDFVCALAAHVLRRCRAELVTLERDLTRIEAVTPPFPRVSYTDAVEMVKKAGEAIEWGDDFGAPHEAIISGQFDKPVFVHRFPSAAKAFYMRPDPTDETLSLSADLLAPEGYGEIIGGGERLADLAVLEKRLEEHKLPREAFEWYLDLRRYGSVPHGGFGLGIERTLSWICGLDHVRETIPFPRMLYRLRP